MGVAQSTPAEQASTLVKFKLKIVAFSEKAMVDLNNKRSRKVKLLVFTLFIAIFFACYTLHLWNQNYLPHDNTLYQRMIEKHEKLKKKSEKTPFYGLNHADTYGMPLFYFGL